MPPARTARMGSIAIGMPLFIVLGVIVCGPMRKEGLVNGQEARRRVRG